MGSSFRPKIPAGIWKSKPQSPTVAPPPSLSPAASSVALKVPADSVEALVENRAIQDRLARGLTFLHNKRPAADMLMALVREVHVDGVRYIASPETTDSLAVLKQRVILPSEGRRSRAKRLDAIVVEYVGEQARLDALVREIAGTHRRKAGFWVRGHPQDFHPSIFRLFDTMFLFDMSDGDLDVVRGSIPLPDSRVNSLRKGVSALESDCEQVLVFTAGADKDGKRVGQVLGNPALLALRRSTTQVGWEQAPRMSQA